MGSTQIIYKHMAFLTVSVFAMFIILPFPQAYASDNDDVDLRTSSDHWLDISNMKPGDQSEETLTMKNQGKEDFFYDISSELKSGSDALFQALEMQVTDEDDNEIYEGDLSDLTETNFESRNLASRDDEELTFAVELPETHKPQNELQGKSIHFVVAFHAEVEGDQENGIPVNGKERGSGADGDETDAISHVSEGTGIGFDMDERDAGLDHGETIPQTGEEQYSVMIGVGLLAVIFGLLLMIVRRRKREA